VTAAQFEDREGRDLVERATEGESVAVTCQEDGGYRVSFGSIQEQHEAHVVLQRIALRLIREGVHCRFLTHNGYVLLELANHVPTVTVPRTPKDIP
jgi:hypothetical protein